MFIIVFIIVNFHFHLQRTLNDNEKSKMQDELSRSDSQKDRNNDLLKWTKSVYKSDEHKVCDTIYCILLIQALHNRGACKNIIFGK